MLKLMILIIGSIEFAELEPIRFGLARHFGDVLCGDIGGGQVARFHLHWPRRQSSISSRRTYSEVRPRSILASAEFERYCDAKLIPVGEFSRIVKPETAFGVRDESG